MWSLSRAKTAIERSSISPVVRLADIRWGALALVSLYLSLISGVLLGLQYEYSTPLYATTTIDLLIPFGGFLRSLHFYSSQVFFLLSCCHLIATYRLTINYQRMGWYKLIATLPTILLLLFTGYVLRGDSTGFSAGIIAESILETVPLLGDTLNNLLFSVSANGLRKVYLHHVITFDLLLLVFAWNHLRMYRVRTMDHVAFIALLLAFCALVSAPMEPPIMGAENILGPWFFIGLQELLRYLPPFIAGIVIPLLFLWLLLSIQPQEGGQTIRIKMLLLALAAYGGLTLIGWIR